MEFKDYYLTLGVERSATHDQIRRAYRKLARKYHPDVSKEPHAEARFKELAEAHEALIDKDRRAAYDEIVSRHDQGQAYEPPPGWDPGYEPPGRGDGARESRSPMSGADFSDFFESLFGRSERGSTGRRASGFGPPQNASDQHAKVLIDLEDVFRGARRTISLREQSMDAQGHRVPGERRIEVNIPKGIREGQHLRLAGQGSPGHDGGPAGDLFLEIALRPHPRFRIDGRDVYMDLPVAPWEAALGASVTASTPEGDVQLTVPAGSSQGRKLRLKGRGLPGKQPGDLYALLGIALPRSDSDAAREAYASLAKAFPHYDPRAALEK